MRFSSIISVLALSIGLAACGGDGDDAPAVDARTSDARGPDGGGAVIDAPAGGSNALGTICSQTVACPAGNTCTGVGGVGSQTMGWCTPMCTQMGGECAAGYTGPAGGMPVCALTTMMGAPPSQCAIVCTGTPQCPTGLTCQPVPGQMNPISICAVPA